MTFARLGGAEVLEVSQLPAPEPGPGEVRVRVAAATVNPTGGDVGLLRFPCFDPFQDRRKRACAGDSLGIPGKLPLHVVKPLLQLGTVSEACGDGLPGQPEPPPEE